MYNTAKLNQARHSVLSYLKDLHCDETQNLPPLEALRSSAGRWTSTLLGGDTPTVVFQTRVHGKTVYYVD